MHINKRGSRVYIFFFKLNFRFNFTFRLFENLVLNIHIFRSFPLWQNKNEKSCHTEI